MGAVCRHSIVCLAIAWLLVPAGCLQPKLASRETSQWSGNAFIAAAQTELDHLEVAPVTMLSETPQPRTVGDGGPIEYWDITLDESIRIALEHSQVLRDLGGRLLTQSNLASTSLNPNIVATDARVGIDAALSAFDAQLSGSVLWRRNNRGLKQPPFGSVKTEIDQRTQTSRAAITKILQTGTRVEVQQGLDYDKDDLGIPPNRFPSAFTPFVGAEVRHPLARGGGRQTNLIAGPNATPGTYNGVLIARIRADIAESDFEIALRDYLYNIIRNYWLLQFAYARLEANNDHVEVAQQLVAAAEKRLQEGTGDIEQVNQARERLLTAELNRQGVFAGAPERQLAGILGTNGAFLAGTDLGVLAVERRLRFLMGLPPSDGRLLRTVDTPSTAPYAFDWNEALSMAMARRPELNRQLKLVKQRRLEFLASKNQLLPTVDLIGQYRVLGFGDQLFGNQYIPQDGAMDELASAQLQEWAAGMEIKWPVGNRIGHTAEQNALLVLSREEAVLRQQQLQVSHELSSAASELQRAKSALQLSQQRFEVAQTRRVAIQRKFDEGIPVAIEQVWEAQLREADSMTGLALASADYGIAMASFSVARGTFLGDLNIGMSEGCQMPTVSPPESIEPSAPISTASLLNPESIQR